MLAHVIGTEEPDYTTPYDVNIIGEYNLAGEMWQVEPLLKEIGFRILSCISGDAKYHEVARSHRARATMMVCSKAMINITRKLEDLYSIPYFEGSFYGIGDMSDSIRQLAQLCIDRGAPAEFMDRVEAVIEREEKLAWDEIMSYLPRLKGKKVLLITGGVKSCRWSRRFRKSAWKIVGTSVQEIDQGR